MTKSELIRELSQSMDMPLKRAREIVDILLGAMDSALTAGERIEIRGFGSVSIKEYEPRMTRNPRTGESMYVGARRSLVFKPGKELKTRVDGACNNN